MKVAVMGAGAVGCYYGAMLARAMLRLWRRQSLPILLEEAALARSILTRQGRESDDARAA